MALDFERHLGYKTLARNLDIKGGATAAPER